MILSNSRTKINDHEFENSNFKSIVIPKSVEYIGEAAFKGCKYLKNINIIAQIDVIEPYTFADCELLESIIIPNSVKEIRSNAFAGCVNLKSISLPLELKLLSNEVFSGCRSLKAITLPESIEFIGRKCFKNCCELCGLIVPKQIRILSKGLFSGCEKLEFAIIQDTIILIDKHAFKKCTSFQSFSDSYLYYNNEYPKLCKHNKSTHFCCSVMAIHVPKLIKKIDSKAFYESYVVAYGPIPTDVIPNGFLETINEKTNPQYPHPEYTELYYC